MEVARGAGIPLSSVCGGRLSCGRCKVRLVSGSVTPPGDGERARLTGDEIADGFRLACAARVLGDLRVDIPPGSLVETPRVLLSGEGRQPVPDPVVWAYELRLPEASPDASLNAWDSLRTDMKGLYGLEDLRADPVVLPELPSALRASKPQAAVLIRGNEVIGVRPRGRKLLGMAFDLGTTTIAAYLVDLRTAGELATKGIMNPQIARGEDVISRISYALQGGADELRASALAALNRLIREAVGDPEEVTEVTIVGNTAMHHLILGLPVKRLGTAPYEPAVYEPLDVKARELGLRIARGAYAHFLSNVAGFVGGDHVSMLLATRIWDTDRTVIGIDVGTNTEVTLASGGNLTSLSCASGPAFEGGRIGHGMRAAEGAIERVEIDEQGIHLGVVHGVRPTGVCGSGIIDLLAQLQLRGIIGQRGELRDHPMVRQGAQGPEFVLAPGDATGTGRDIVITQRDIGEIQLAKAAIRGGIDVLLNDAGIGEAEIEEVLVAGAFGQNLNPNSAVDIGLFPPIAPQRFTRVGNAAGTGAKLALVSRRERALAERIAARVRYIELTTHPQFSRHFSRALRFPAPGAGRR